MAEDNGTLNPNPEGGKGTEEKTQKTKPEDLIFGRFQTMEEADKGYKELHSDYNRKVEELRKLEAEKETSLENITGANTEIEELKKQIEDLKTPKPAGRYNTDYLKKVSDLVGIEESKAGEFVDLIRAVPAYDRQQEAKRGSEIANKRETQKQWNKIKDDYGVDTIREIAPEIGAVFEELPELMAKAHENPNAMRRAVQLAEKIHEEKAEAIKAEQELRDAEKEAGQTGGPTGGGKGVDDDEGLSLKQLEEKYGWNPKGGPINPA